MKTARGLFWIKVLHTIAWAFFAGCVFYSGLSGNISEYTWWTMDFVVVEALTLFAFRWTCPLTIVARRYSDSEKHNFDIFLPEWLAKHNKTIFTALFLLGVALVAVRIYM